MHGSATAMFAIVSKALGDRVAFRSLRLLLPGLELAVVLHAACNRLMFQPLLTTALLLITMPQLLLVVFQQSERATRDWLGAGLDGEVRMLEQILEGEVSGTPVGHDLETLRAHFAPLMVADLLCLLRIHLELSPRAKGMLMARAAGIEVPLDASVHANLEEMRFLERSVGTTGRLAFQPLRRTSSRELWQVMRLSEEAGRRSGRR
jgi:hypothetical protein